MAQSSRMQYFNSQIFLTQIYSGQISRGHFFPSRSSRIQIYFDVTSKALSLTQSIPLTGAVVVCTPQAVALADAVRAARMYETLGVPVLGMVENMSYFIAPDTGHEYDLFGRGGVEKAARELGVPFLGSIPINVAIRITGDAGSPDSLFADDPQGIRASITCVVEALAARISLRSALKLA